MAGRDEESQKVMAAAQRAAKYGDRSELERFSLQVLQKADYQLSDRDQGSGYRRALSDRIAELKLAANVKATKKPSVVQVQPSFYGISIDFNELGRRVSRWWKSRSN